MTLKLLTDPTAVCNDGSPAGYYYAVAENTTESNLWLVYLEGAMFCWARARPQQLLNELAAPQQFFPPPAASSAQPDPGLPARPENPPATLPGRTKPPARSGTRRTSTG